MHFTAHRNTLRRALPNNDVKKNEVGAKNLAPHLCRTGPHPHFYRATPCYSEVDAVVVCPSVRPSVTSRCCVDTTRRIKVWTKKISPRQVNRVVNKTRRRSSLLTTLVTRRSTVYTHRVHMLSVLYVRRPYNAPTPLLRYVADLLYNLFLCSREAVDESSTDVARRAVRLRR